MGKWGDRSKEAIQEAFLVWTDAYGTHPTPRMSDADKAKFMRILDKHYPFCERERWPYKAWLKERRKVKDWLFRKPEPIDTGLFAEVGDAP